MVRILLFIILAVLILSVVYFQYKIKGGKKFVTMIAMGLTIGSLGLIAQSIASTYLAVLLVIGLSLLFSLVYAKKFEESLQTRTQTAIRKKTAEKTQVLETSETNNQENPETVVQKSLSMNKITKFKEEQEVEQ